MFESISWNEFITALILTITGYYVFTNVLYYCRELILSIKSITELSVLNQQEHINGIEDYEHHFIVSYASKPKELIIEVSKGHGTNRSLWREPSPVIFRKPMTKTVIAKCSETVFTAK